MANYWFGDYAGSANTGAWATLSNWYIDPGSGPGCCCSVAGTPAATLPTTADTVILVATLSTVPAPGVSGWNGSGKWTGPIVMNSGTLSTDWFTGTLTTEYAPTYIYGNGPPTLAYGGGSCSISSINTGAGITFASGTFPNPIFFSAYYVSSIITGGTFNGAMTLGTGGGFVASGGTFNGSIAWPGGNPGLQFGGTSVVNTTFNPTSTAACSFKLTGSAVLNVVPPIMPGGACGYDFSGTPTLGFSGDMILGNASYGNAFRLAIPTSKNIIMRGTAGTSFSGSYVYFDPGGNYTGNITIPTLQAGRLLVTGASTYAPPAVTTPAIKSGNNMTFASSAIPADLGFKAAGGTFNPTILLSGTSNDILGAGLQ